MRNVVLALLLFALNATAATVSGRWSGHFRVDGGDHDIPQLFTFKQDGSKLTGSGGPDESEQYPLENGKVEGDRIQFEITTGEWKFAYDLKLDGTTMTGILQLTSLNDHRTAKVSLTK
ncbi:MAG TPA: hypothetical protein VGS27_19330 [Candidatus Sulfotelmatobacter sp.]|nr:hypothetical protein [Candidatus Sulfotelmatobacter sp.]